MEMISEIKVNKIKNSKISEVDFTKLEFGKNVSDHMLICDFTNGAWQTPTVMPFANLSLSPTALALHYGQTVFEGMKAFRTADGKINIFRIGNHYHRLTRSLSRMCMEIIPKDIFVEGMLKLVQTDAEWIPHSTDSALYIRPFMYASEAKFGIKISEEYRFVIFTGPVPLIYNRALKLKVETKYIRAAKGGTGFAKCGGNYGGALYPTKEAREQGYDQVLWTDARYNKYIEESGAMNMMFVIDGTLVTPPLSDSILDGVTRDSLLTLAKDLGIPVEERPVSIHELEKAFRDNTITEAFGAGTAVVVVPIGTINIDGMDFTLPPVEDPIQVRLKHKLDNVRLGLDEDIHGWNFIF